MVGQKGPVGNNFPVYKVDVALYNFSLKSIIPNVLGTKVSVLSSQGSLVLNRGGGGRKLLEAGDHHTLHVYRLLPFQEVGTGGPPACPLIGQKICDQPYKDQGLDKWLHLYSNTWLALYTPNQKMISQT